MMQRQKKQTVLCLAALVFGGILGGLAFCAGSTWLMAPLTGFGQWLREMSLSGEAGDLIAWSAVIVCSVLPGLGLLWKGREPADWLLILLGAEIFAMLYFLANPFLAAPGLSWMGSEAADAAWAVVSFGCVAATAISWALLRLLKRLKHRSAELLPAFLAASAIVLALLLGWSAVTGTLQQVRSVAAGNTDLQRVAVTGYLLIFTGLLELIPEFLGIWLLILGGNLVPRLASAPFEEETVALAEQIAGRAGTVAGASLLLTVLGNFVQLLMFSKAAQINVRVHLPIGTLIGCAALMLLCRYFRQAKQISDDNATII